MNDDELGKIVDAAVKRAFRDVLDVDIESLDEIREVKADIQFSRENRKRCKSLVGRLINYFFLAMAGGGIWLVGEGIQRKIGM